MVVEESQLHEFHMDFAFLGGEDYPGMSVPTLVVRKRSTKMVMAAAFPSKSTNSCIARRVVAFMQEVGCVCAQKHFGGAVATEESSLALRGAMVGGVLVIPSEPLRSWS